MHQNKIFEFYSTSSVRSLTFILPVYHTFNYWQECGEWEKGVPPCKQVYLEPGGQSVTEESHVQTGLRLFSLTHCASASSLSLSQDPVLQEESVFCWAPFRALCWGFLPLTLQALSMLYASYFKCSSFLNQNRKLSLQENGVLLILSAFFFFLNYSSPNLKNHIPGVPHNKRMYIKELRM